jgi:hypothetical protein
MPRYLSQGEAGEVKTFWLCQVYVLPWLRRSLCGSVAFLDRLQNLFLAAYSTPFVEGISLESASTRVAIRNARAVALNIVSAI